MKKCREIGCFGGPERGDDRPARLFGCLNFGKHRREGSHPRDTHIGRRGGRARGGRTNVAVSGEWKYTGKYSVDGWTE